MKLFSVGFVNVEKNARDGDDVGKLKKKKRKAKTRNEIIFLVFET